MKALFRAVIAGGLLLTATAGSAQYVERVYDRGSVWTVSYVETKPGQFNGYMADLGKNWRAQRALAQKRGDELSYKVLQVADARDGEPNLILMVEYKNWAARDRSLADIDAETKQRVGSLDKNRQMNMDREAMRTARGSLAANDLQFTK